MCLDVSCPARRASRSPAASRGPPHDESDRLPRERRHGRRRAARVDDPRQGDTFRGGESFFRSPEPSDAVYYPLYTKCCELDLPLCMNTGIPGPPIPGEAQNPMHLDRVCVRFPELRLCMIHGADPDAALAEVSSLLERGARIVHVRPAPVPSGSGGGRSLGDPLHDPIWARLAEAGVPVAFHLGDSGYNAFAGAWGAASTFEGFGNVDVLSRLIVSDRPIHDTLGSLVLH
ncbi:MAG: amidohydrolase family protein, partial [Myxococcota bacterium]